MTETQRNTPVANFIRLWEVTGCVSRTIRHDSYQCPIAKDIWEVTVADRPFGTAEIRNGLAQLDENVMLTRRLRSRTQQ